MTSEQPASGAPQDASGPHEVVLRRSPKYSTFMALGAAVGIVVALTLTVSQSVDANYTFGQVLGFLLLVCVILGLFVGGVVAIVLDRIVSRHAHTVLVQRVVERTEPDTVPESSVETDAGAPAPEAPAVRPDAAASAPPETGLSATSGFRSSEMAAPVRRSEAHR